MKLIESSFGPCILCSRELLFRCSPHRFGIGPRCHVFHFGRSEEPHA